MLGNSGIRMKLFFAFGIIVFFILCLSVVSVVMTTAIAGNYNYIIEKQLPVSDTLMESQIAMSNFVLALNAYFKKNDDESKKDAYEAKERMKKTIDYAREELKGNKIMLDEIEKTVFARAAQIFEIGEKIMGSGSGSAGKNQEILIENAHKILDDLKEDSVALELQTKELIAENDKDAVNTFKNMRLMSVVMSLFITVLAAAIAWLITRSITKPLGEAIKDLENSAQQVTSASAQVASSSQTLAQGASEQASALEETSSSLEEMSSMIAMNADNSAQANKLSKEADSVTRDGVKAMENMTSSVERIKSSTDKTAKIIKTIDEIAFQTNLLALNAAVEAARAGDAGKGFAVVAEEVRNLARRAADAAKSTNELIEDVRKNVDSGVNASAEMMEMLGRISEKISKVSALSSEVSAASAEQDKGIKQITSAVSEMDKVTQGNSASAEQSASAAEELSSQAVEMKEAVEKITRVVYGGGDQNKTSSNMNINIKEAIKNVLGLIRERFSPADVKKF